MHSHGGKRRHLHAHSHQGAGLPHGEDPHDHRHPEGFPVRALLIGLVHGAAGSAGLLALAVAATQEPWAAVGYVALFGLGSILGMAVLTYAAAWPLGAAERHAKRVYQTMSLGAAALAIGLGVQVMSDVGALAWGFG